MMMVALSGNVGDINDQLILIPGAVCVVLLSLSNAEKVMSVLAVVPQTRTIGAELNRCHHRFFVFQGQFLLSLRLT